MKLTDVELRRIRMPLRLPFATARGVEHERDILLVKVTTSDAVGWGECVALQAPGYSAEYVEGAHAVLRAHLVPALVAAQPIDAAGVGPALAGVRGHRMAKAALETAVLDAELRADGVSLATYLGGVRAAVDAGVAVGMTSTVDELVSTVGEFVAEGYRRVKLKIAPGWDLAPVAAVRRAFGDGLLLQVDGNGAYSMADADHLARLDDLDLLLIEQPLPSRDLVGHAQLAGRLVTPICLDESIESVNDAVTALALGACSVINIKPGRVGGLFEARRIHDLCRDRGIPVWCGGMYETGIGRATNVALAALAGFTLPGDLSASSRYYAPDITTPFELAEGRLEVPTGPGIGVEPLAEVLAEVTTAIEHLPT